MSVLTVRLLTLSTVLIVLLGCITTPGYKQTIIEKDFYLHISAPNNIAKQSIRFNFEQTDVEYLPADTSIELSVKNGFKERYIKIEAEDNTLIYSFKINGNSANFGAKEQTWFASYIPTIIEKSGLSVYISDLAPTEAMVQPKVIQLSY